MNDKTLQLFNLEAEKSVISAVLMNPDTYYSVCLDSGDFYDDAHRKVWLAISVMAAEKTPIDVITVSEKSGIEFSEIMKITEHITVYSFAVADYAAIVKDKAMRRRVVDIAERIVKMAYRSESMDTGAYVDELIDNSSRQHGAATHISDYAYQVMIELDEKMRNPEDIWGLSTGFREFDRITGGLQQGESVILSGEPGVGKSLLGVQMGIQLGQNGIPGAIYSLEMQGKAVARRAISCESKIKTKSIKRGEVNDEQYKAVTDAINRLNQLPVYMSDASYWTLTELHADLARLKRKAGIKWFLLDYLYLLDPGRAMNEIEATTILSRGVKQICKSLDLAGITIHSMNKTGMDTNTVGKSMLRGSGQVVYDADLICMLKKDDAEEYVRHFKIVKGRELEDDNPYFDLIKSPNYPYFGEAQTNKIIL